MVRAVQPRIRTCPFTVWIDHREQLPWSFDDVPPKAAWNGSLSIPVERTRLVAGDYTIAGMQDQFAIERKSLEDLYGTLGQRRELFEEEIKRLNEMQFAAIIVEATVREVWNPAAGRPEWMSSMKPRAVEATMVAWSIRYPRVHWWCVGDHRAGEVRAFETMEKFWCVMTDTENFWRACLKTERITQ